MQIVKMGDGAIGITTKYTTLILYFSPKTWWWDWRIDIPKFKNWHRFLLATPVLIFTISGWLFWGKRPKEVEADGN